MAWIWLGAGLDLAGSYPRPARDLPGMRLARRCLHPAALAGWMGRDETEKFHEVSAVWRRERFWDMRGVNVEGICTRKWTGGWNRQDILPSD